jgi:hypothetical protein
MRVTDACSQALPATEVLKMVHREGSSTGVPGRFVVLAIVGMAMVLALLAVRYRNLSPRALPPAATTASTTAGSDSP